MLTKLKLRFTVAAILISALILSIVMAAIIFVSSLEVWLGINRTVEHSLDQVRFTNNQILGIEDSECMIILYANDQYYTARSELYTEEEQRGLINEMLRPHQEKHFIFDGHDYVFGIREQGNVLIYAVYDATGELVAVNHIWKIVLIAYVIVLVVVAIVASRLSNMVLKPVNDALQKQKDLIANASHELKTPITIIETDLTLARNGIEETSESHKWLNGIETQTKRMNSLVKEMLELSRLESNLTMNVDKVAFSDLIESMTLELEAGCFEKAITLNSDIASGVIVYSDEEKLRRLISILLNNAYKYTPDGGSITVKMENKKSQVIVSVSNTGEGIPPEKLPHIFERFYKVDESHTGESNSFGLGLAIAKSLIDSLGGWIKCESVVNDYTTFKFMVPANLRRPDKPDKSVE